MRRMIRVTIQEQAEKCGFTTAYQLQKAIGVQPSVAALLWKGDLQKIGINSIDRLCRALKCQPDKLLRYEPDSDGTESPPGPVKAAKKNAAAAKPTAKARRRGSND